MSVEPNSEYLTWVDIETTDLQPSDHGRILEIGFKVTDLDLKEFDSFRATIGYDDLDELRSATNEYVRNMHDKNNLWNDCANSLVGLSAVEDLARSWWTSVSRELGIEDRSMPLAGSSLAMDRRFLDYWMPNLHAMFHYRSIDNSSIKEMCRRYNPELYAKLQDSETDHRVFTCLEGTISEFKFYKDNFIFDGRE